MFNPCGRVSPTGNNQGVRASPSIPDETHHHLSEVISCTQLSGLSFLSSNKQNDLGK